MQAHSANLWIDCRLHSTDKKKIAMYITKTPLDQLKVEGRFL